MSGEPVLLSHLAALVHELGVKLLACTPEFGPLHVLIHGRQGNPGLALLTLNPSRPIRRVHEKHQPLAALGRRLETVLDSIGHGVCVFLKKRARFLWIKEVVLEDRRTGVVTLVLDHQHVGFLGCAHDEVTERVVTG